MCIILTQGTITYTNYETHPCLISTKDVYQEEEHGGPYSLIQAKAQDEGYRVEQFRRQVRTI